MRIMEKFILVGTRPTAISYTGSPIIHLDIFPRCKKKKKKGKIKTIQRPDAVVFISRCGTRQTPLFYLAIINPSFPSVTCPLPYPTLPFNPPPSPFQKCIYLTLASTSHLRAVSFNSFLTHLAPCLMQTMLPATGTVATSV